MKLVVKPSYHLDILRTIHDYIFYKGTYSEHDTIHAFINIYSIQSYMKLNIDSNILYSNIYDLALNNILVAHINAEITEITNYDTLFSDDYITFVSINPNNLRYFKIHPIFNTIFIPLHNINHSYNKLFDYNFIWDA